MYQGRVETDAINIKVKVERGGNEYAKEQPIHKGGTGNTRFGRSCLKMVKRLRAARACTFLPFPSQLILHVRALDDLSHFFFFLIRFPAPALLSKTYSQTSEEKI